MSPRLLSGNLSLADAERDRHGGQYAREKAATELVGVAGRYSSIIRIRHWATGRREFRR